MSRAGPNGDITRLRRCAWFRAAADEHHPDGVMTERSADAKIVSYTERRPMVLAADYPFLNILWSMIIFFAWVVWIWMMIVILGDVFRRRDIGGWTKAVWVVFMIVLPFLGVLVYLIAQHDGMAQRQADAAKAADKQMGDYVRSVAGGATEEIAKAKKLYDDGTINQAEFEALKTNALAPA
jgi:hypothetical protein